MEKLEFCLKKTKECLEKAKMRDDSAAPLMQFARDYYNDALYYREKDPETALEAAAYAHGFIDAAVLLGLIEIPDYHLKKQRKS
jgi:hypothetical protein